MFLLNTTTQKMIDHLNQRLTPLSQLLLLISMISVFVPFSPKLPAPGLDASWALALNQAVAQGLAFGKEIIFTLGPYSSIYTKAYHPATNLMMMIGSLYLAISYWFALLFLLKKTRWYWILIFCVPFLGMLYARDSLFFSYSLLVGIISIKLMNSDNHCSNVNKRHPLLIAIFFAPFGLLSLIKGSMLILCFTVLLFCFVYFLINKKSRLALVCLAAPMASLILFWCVSGQALIHLPSYLISSISMASGFTEAMSTYGSSNDMILYLITVCFILSFILLNKKLQFSTKIFLLCIFFAFLFLSFKTGFTRQVGHAFIPGTSILLAGIFLLFIDNFRSIFLILLACFTSWYFINGQHTRISILDNFKSTYTAAWHGFKSRIQDPHWMESNFRFTMDFLKEQADFPKLQGTTDIYSYHQSYLIASQTNWLPRPIFQSYSVFTSSLAQKNKQHLEKRYSPDTIIFKIEPIDGRVPSLEDGASWPLLITKYQPTTMKHDFLVLHKKVFVPKERTFLLPRTFHHLGEQVKLPDSPKPLFASIEIKPTLWGRLATIFFKPTPLQISLHLKNGTIKQYRLIANMTKSGFLLSPLIENTNEFSQLYQNNNQLNEKEVTFFKITIPQDHNWFWNQAYQLNLYYNT